MSNNQTDETFSNAVRAAAEAFTGTSPSVHYFVMPCPRDDGAVDIHLTGPLGSPFGNGAGAVELSRATGLRVHLCQTPHGREHRLTAPLTADFADLRRRMDAAMPDATAAIAADAAAIRAQKEARASLRCRRPVRQKQPTAAARRAAGEILVTVASPSRHAGQIGDVVWIKGEPMEFTAAPRKFLADDTDVDTGRVDALLEGEFVMSGWVKPVSPERRAALLTRRA